MNDKGMRSAVRGRHPSGKIIAFWNVEGEGKGRNGFRGNKDIACLGNDICVMGSNYLLSLRCGRLSPLEGKEKDEKSGKKYACDTHQRNMPNFVIGDFCLLCLFEGG